jgi:hypothetical protein
MRFLVFFFLVVESQDNLDNINVKIFKIITLNFYKLNKIKKSNFYFILK